jgi:hypothetical protein
MKKSLLAMCMSLATFSALFAQHAILHESNNLRVKSLYSSLVIGEETAVFYEVLGKDLGEIIPKVVLNGTLIDSLQSPIAIAADKGPYVCLVFVFKKGTKATAVETVWIPVTKDHNTQFILTDRDTPFEKVGEVRLMSELVVTPLVGTSTRHCTSLYLREVKASLISGGTMIVETTTNTKGLDMQPIRMKARENDQISVKVVRLGCTLPDYSTVDIDLPLADAYVKAKFTDVKTLPTFTINKE